MMAPKGGDNSRTRRRDGLAIEMGPLERMVFKEFQSSGGGNRQRPMSGLSDAPAQGHRGKNEGIDAEVMSSDSRGHDINNGVNGTDFMEVDILRPYAVDFSLSLRQPGKYSDGSIFNLSWKTAPLDQSSDLLPAPFPPLVLCVNAKAGGMDPVGQLLADIDTILKPG